MVIEDFTTYEEVDPNEHIERTSSRVTFSGITRPESAYVYKDKGSGHFSGDFKHDVDVRYTACVLNSLCILWGLFNAVGDWAEAKGSPENCLYIYFGGEGANDAKIVLLCYRDGTAYSDFWSFPDAGTTYYLRIKRTGNVVTCGIYGSASDRDSETNAIITLSTGDMGGVTAFQHIYACQSMTYGTVDYPMSGYVENLNLHEPTAHYVTVAEKLGMVDAVKPVRGVHVTAAETLGLKDAVTRKKHVYVTAAEKLGLLDDVKRAKGIHVTAAEKLGLVDDYFKRVTAGRLLDNPDNVGSRGSPIYKDMPDYMGAVYVNTKNTWQDAENLDELHDYISYMWIPEETFKVKLMKLCVFPEKFRAYSKTTEYVTPDHAHDVIIGTATSGGSSMWTSVYLPTELITRAAHETTDPNSTLYSFSAIITSYYTDICEKAHYHGVNYGTKTSEEGGGKHRHKIEYGIYEETPTGVTVSAILYDPKGNPLEEWDPLTTYPTPVTLDLTEYFKDLKYGHYYLKLTVSGRMRVRLVYYELGIMFAM